ncbi:hypothetical protein GJ744_011322 [Endocarpon pusillum]|uniref:Uncharacterized protein n=1 Tax=Endocarpon pusillum TaxID=364733 RepID=A0A8H7EAS9_9EURO|nr:hypothetical protein GJ744_011322 [Endocarpon pusillum]
MRYTSFGAMALPRNDILALATLILSIPGIVATIIGVLISYRSFKQFKTLCELSAGSLPAETLTISLQLVNPPFSQYIGFLPAPPSLTQQASMLMLSACP